MNKIIGLGIVLLSLLIPITFYIFTQVRDYNYEISIEEKLVSNAYYAIIEIDNISLKRELYEINDPQNNVDKNIFVHEKSTFPSSSNSNIILASHSGIGSNAYFKDLYKLKINDQVKIYYNNFIWSYVIKEIEYQEKTGTLYLKEAYPEMLTLITCTKNDAKTQTIYYASLEKKSPIG